MNQDTVVNLATQAMSLAVKIAGPLLLVALVLGVLVSVFQAVTQIQEQTLIFVPKILAIFVTLLLALPFMADALHANFLRIAAHITNG